METVTIAEETKQPTRKKIRRLQIGLNVLVQVVLVLFLAAMMNSIAFKHYRRWDFSRDKKYALSDKTKRFLNTIKGKVRITVFFSPNTPITVDVQNLLTEFQYAAKAWTWSKAKRTHSATCLAIKNHLSPETLRSPC